MKRFPVLCSLALAGLAGCTPHESARRTDAPVLPTVAVQTATVRAETVAHGQRLPGTVHPAEEAVIAAKIMATVAEADLAIGQSVEEGEVLLRLRADEMQARLAQAEAGLAQVERNLERERSLLAQGATTAETVRSLEDALRLSQARLDEAQTLVGYTTVAAPYAGIVTAKNVRRGDLATPGAPLLEIQSRGPRQVWVQVPDSLAALDLGATIRLEADHQVLEGHLIEWSPAASPASRTRLAKIALAPDAPVRSGQYVEVVWPAGETRRLSVPATAVDRVGQMDRVFVVADGQAALRLVRPGATRDGRVEILAGLADGETIVAPLVDDLRDGQPVEVRP